MTRIEEREDKPATRDERGPDERGAGAVGEPTLLGRRADQYRRQWSDIQARFVDEPRRAVADADHLVDEAVKQLTDTFAGERSRLEAQWARGGDVSTEDLRQMLQRYRAFFDRLLAL